MCWGGGGGGAFLHEICCDPKVYHSPVSSAKAEFLDETIGGDAFFLGSRECRDTVLEACRYVCVCPQKHA